MSQLVVGGPPPPELEPGDGGDDSCVYATGGSCDEPEDCEQGTEPSAPNPAAAQLRHAGELLAKDRAADERCRAMSDAFARQNLALRKEHNATLEKMQRS